MQAGERRKAILELLRQASRPLSAGYLAGRFSVSRQAVVGDVALLRASGADISATPRGYVILKARQGLIRQVACRHDGLGMEAELCAVVDQGCSVLDVIVDHPVYGQLTGPPQPLRCGPVPLPLRRGPAPVGPHRGHPPPHPLLPGRGRLPPCAGIPGGPGSPVGGLMPCPALPAPWAPPAGAYPHLRGVRRGLRKNKKYCRDCKLLYVFKAWGRLRCGTGSGSCRLGG